MTTLEMSTFCCCCHHTTAPAVANAAASAAKSSNLIRLLPIVLIGNPLEPALFKLFYTNFSNSKNSYKIVMKYLYFKAL
jgi:hypothetical protein